LEPWNVLLAKNLARLILQDANLLISVRNEYLNVSCRGQSIFKVEYDGKHITAMPYPKYLIDRNSSSSYRSIFTMPVSANFPSMPS
jgi:hypothetical protein